MPRPTPTPTPVSAEAVLAQALAAMAAAKTTHVSMSGQLQLSDTTLPVNLEADIRPPDLAHGLARLGQDRDAELYEFLQIGEAFYSASPGEPFTRGKRGDSPAALLALVDPLTRSAEHRRFSQVERLDDETVDGVALYHLGFRMDVAWFNEMLVASSPRGGETAAGGELFVDKKTLLPQRYLLACVKCLGEPSYATDMEVDFRFSRYDAAIRLPVPDDPPSLLPAPTPRPTPTPTPTPARPLVPTPTPTPTAAIGPTIRVQSDASDFSVESDGTLGPWDLGDLVVGDSAGGSNLGRRGVLKFDLSSLPSQPVYSAVVRLTLIESRKDQYPAPGVIDMIPPFTNPGLSDTLVVHVAPYSAPTGAAYAAPSIGNDPGVLIGASEEPGRVVSISVREALVQARATGATSIAFRIQTAVQTDGDALNDSWGFHSANTRDVGAAPVLEVVTLPKGVTATPTPTPTPTVAVGPAIRVQTDASGFEAHSDGTVDELNQGAWVVGDDVGGPNLGKRAVLKFDLAALAGVAIHSAVLKLTVMESRRGQFPGPGDIDTAPPFTNPGLGDTLVVHVAPYSVRTGAAFAAPSIGNDPGILIGASEEPGRVVSISVREAVVQARAAGAAFVAFRVQTDVQTDGDALPDSWSFHSANNPPPGATPVLEVVALPAGVTATPTLARTPTPTPFPTAYGIVLWNERPVPGAVVQLRPKGDPYTTPVLAQAVVDANTGVFHIPSPPVGEFMVYAIAPSAEFWDRVEQPVTVPESRRVNVGTIYLSKKLVLETPAPGSAIGTRTPTLRWKGFPDAVRYYVNVFDYAAYQMAFKDYVQAPATEALVGIPLTPGQRYGWSVWALNAQGRLIAHAMWDFTVSANAPP